MLKKPEPCQFILLGIVLLLLYLKSLSLGLVFLLYKIGIKIDANKLGIWD